MKSLQKNSFLARNLHIWILIFIAAVCSLLTVLNVTVRLDGTLYDALLGASKTPKEDRNILLVDIEDKSLEEAGEWPWSRNILADVLLRMKEFGAYNAVFDIEYLSPSSLSVADGINELTENAFAGGQQAISSGVLDFAAMVDRGEIPQGHVKNAASDLLGNTIDPALYEIYGTVASGLTRDNDDYFARALQFFGNSSLTINMRNIGVTSTEEDRSYIINRFLFSNVSDAAQRIDRGNNYTVREENQGVGRGFGPAIPVLMNHAAGAGFTNVVVDKDGTRRRVELLNRNFGRFAGQLAFSPLLRMLDVQSMERKHSSLLVKGALLPGETERKDFYIPLDNHGRMMINWLHKSYEESFKHVGVYAFLYMDRDEAKIHSSLLELSDFYGLNATSLPVQVSEFMNANIEPLIQSYEGILEYKNYLLSLCNGFDEQGNAIGGGISPSDYEDYFALRQDFFATVKEFSASLAQEPSLSDIQSVQNLNEASQMYIENFNAMQAHIQNAFCIIGNSATGSTDLGVTPFSRHYANLGTHANVVNTILSQDFITYVSVWWGMLISFAAALAVLIVTGKKGSAAKTVTGIIYLIVPGLVIYALMVGQHVYIPMAMPVIFSAAVYLAELALSFTVSEMDKNTLRRGFDAYVAPEVVSEIVKNPGLLGLGGVNKHITALFSDVRSFSAFTECVNREEGEQHGAVRLVDILNGYLGMLSDAIMHEKGTIDKYVGDEIVSFFGAPIENPNNAFDSCVAAIRMKQAEDQYNAEHLKDLPIHPQTKTPFLLKSRVGINTGDMVVGNMGTDKKLNYTIMGNNVNLASRLEGTNKAYDSWIMVSESTWKEADSGANSGLLIAKQLDCVKVINVEKPVQIYSIIGLKSELSEAQIQNAHIFNKGMEWYLRGRENPGEPKDLADFLKARHFFEEAYSCWHTQDPQDKNFISTEKKMILRCENFIANGLPVDENGIPKPWDGVYTMLSK